MRLDQFSSRVYWNHSTTFSWASKAKRTVIDPYSSLSFSLSPERSALLIRNNGFIMIKRIFSLDKMLMIDNKCVLGECGSVLHLHLKWSGTIQFDPKKSAIDWNFGKILIKMVFSDDLFAKWRGKTSQLLSGAFDCSVSKKSRIPACYNEC